MGTTVGATILYTDLVDSTALSTSLPAAEVELIRQAHFRMLGEAVEASGGEEVKKLGDGIMAVFPGASAALDAAIAMQRAVRRHNQRDPGPDLSIRVSVSTGDCIAEDGDYFGEPVIQTARLCDACAGDQILVAAVVGFLVPRDAYRLEPVADLQLKGIPDPFPALQLVWDSPAADAEGPIPFPDRLAVETGAAGLSGLVGRRAEREVLVEGLKAAHTGERRVVLVTGEAGLGKTRLTAEFVQEAFSDGVAVLYGRCDEDLAVPYLPWVESLSHLVEHLDDEILRFLDPAVRTQLGRLLPSLRGSGAEGGDGQAASGDQYALFASVCALLGEVAANRTVVIVLDDLHWADRGTLQMLQHVATSLPQSRLLIIGTYRETDLAANQPLTETSARLHRVAGVHRVALVGLSDVEIVQLLEGAAGHGLGDEAIALGQVLRADTAGNPFFVVEVIRHLVEVGAISRTAGRWSMTRDLADIELPQSVRDVVGQRIRRLVGEARTVLTAAAVVGREFDCSVVAGAADLDEDTVLDVLEEAMEAGLVGEVTGTVDRFSFTHALVQHTLYRELSESRRARMHRRVATALEELAAPEPGELAKHWFAVVRPSDLDRAIRYAIEAAERALASAAPDEAVRWFRQAWEALDDGDDELRCEVQVRLGDAERQADLGTYRERLLDAAARAERLGRGDLVIDAALANYRGWHSAIGEIDHERVAVLRSALLQPEAEGGRRARLLATLAGELTYGDEAERLQMAREAEDLARATGDQTTILDALERCAGAINVPEMFSERTRRVAQMMELTGSGDDPVRRFLALDLQADVHLAHSDMAAARLCAVERRELADRLGQTTLQWLATNHEAVLAVVECDFGAATASAEAAFALGTEAGQPDVMSYFGAVLIVMHLEQGRFAEIIPLVRERADAVPGASAFRAVLANFVAQSGETDEAAELLVGMAANRFDFDHDVQWLTSTAMTAEAAAVVGDTDSARVLYERMLPYAEQCIATRAHCLGPTSYYLGVVAASAGDPRRAEGHFRDALHSGRRLRSPFHIARALLGIATATWTTEHADALPLAREALDLAERYGLSKQAATARELLAT